MQATGKPEQVSLFLYGLEKKTSKYIFSIDSIDMQDGDGGVVLQAQGRVFYMGIEDSL
jgi:hypothetical protein